MDNSEIPIGLEMALSRDSKAMEYFSSLSEEEKSKVIDKTHEINSKEEMRSFVHSLPQGIN